MGLTGREGEIRSRNPRQEGDASSRDNGGVVVMVHVAVMAMLLMMPEMVMTLAITTVSMVLVAVLDKVVSLVILSFLFLFLFSRLKIRQASDSIVQGIIKMHFTR